MSIINHLGVGSGVIFYLSALYLSSSFRKQDSIFQDHLKTIHFILLAICCQYKMNWLATGYLSCELKKIMQEKII